MTPASIVLDAFPKRRNTKTPFSAWKNQTKACTSGIFHSSSRISAAKGGQVPSHKLKASSPGPTTSVPLVFIHPCPRPKLASKLTFTLSFHFALYHVHRVQEFSDVVQKSPKCLEHWYQSGVMTAVDLGTPDPQRGIGVIPMTESKRKISSTIGGRD